MISSISGYLILIFFGIVFYLIARFSMKKQNPHSIDSYLLAGRSMRCGMLASSVLVSWTWTTTIVGAAEAGMWYGVSGGLSYSLGAALPFLLFVPLVIRIKRLMPEGITYTEFIGERYGARTKDVYFVFSVLVVIYVFLEQLVGIGLVFRSIFQVSFKLVIILVTIIVILYIIRGGIRGAFISNILHFLIISVLLSIVYFVLIKNIGLHFLYEGLLDASKNESNPNYNTSALLLNSLTGMRYGLISFVVALGQVLMDQGYYSIALSARSEKDLTYGFLLGAVIFWIPVAIISAGVFGHGAIALELSPVQGIDTTTEIAATILNSYGTPLLGVLFAIAIFSIGVSTGGNCLIGILSIFTVDFYSSKLRSDASEEQKIRFGKVFTVCIAALCAFIAIALEGISLLKIDMFSGIFFAAPCGTLISGVYTRFANEKVSLLAIFSGLIAGFSTWIYFNMSGESWFYSCLLSFVIPVIIIVISFPFTKHRFNFSRLRFYKAGQRD